MTLPAEQTVKTERKCTEEILREEIRALRDVGLRLCEWGITLLASIETALWFVRQEVRTTMIGNGLLDKTSPLPWGIYLLGTLFLFLVSGIFILFILQVSGITRGYRKQLNGFIESGIQEQPLKKTARRALVFMFLLIPIVDIIFRAIFPLLLANQAEKMAHPATQLIAPQIAPTSSQPICCYPNVTTEPQNASISPNPAVKRDGAKSRRPLPSR